MARVDTLVRLKDGQSFVRGRSEATARKLLEIAGDRSGEVVTVTHGYIVPTEVADEFGGDSITAADQPAVITEPGTTTNAEEAVNTDANAEGEEAPAEFDPTDATVEEVNTYLEGADEAERDRVLAAEAAGKARKGIIGEEAK